MRSVGVVALALALWGGSETGAQEGAAKRREVAILLYPGVELLDFAGPGEVFAAAGHGDFHVFTVAETREPVNSLGFLSITPQFSLDECPHPDIVVVPGGNVPAANTTLQRWLQKWAQDSELVMSVCNGAALLASSGLVKNQEITTHHGTRAAVLAFDPSAILLTNRRFVDHGQVLTTAGISAGIDGALHVVERLLGEKVARETAEFLEYDWRPEEIAKLHAQPGIRYQDRALELLRMLESGNPEEVLAQVRAAADRGEPVAQERDLSALGYRLWQQQEMERAEKVLRFVVAAYPESPNAWDSLSELVEVTASPGESLCYARRALEKLAAATDLPAVWHDRIQEDASARVQRLEHPGTKVAFACMPCGGPCDAERFTRPGPCPSCGMAMHVVTVAEEPPATAADVWVCPPCGGECDEMEWQVAGNCSLCSMKLVKKDRAP